MIGGNMEIAIVMQMIFFLVNIVRSDKPLINVSNNTFIFGKKNSQLNASSTEKKDD
jgi:hypothetical protein